MSLFKSLRFQIAAPLLIIVLLFAALFAGNLTALEAQRNYNTLLNITARLQHTAQSLVQLAMNYSSNIPQDSASYQRDVKLYYQEIQSQVELFDEITEGFMSENFSPTLTSRKYPFTPRLDPAIQAAVRAIEEAWADFKVRLTLSIGMDERGPRIGEAAAFINGNHLLLTESVDALRSQLLHLASARLDNVRRLNWIALAAVVGVTFGLMIWFYLSIIHPLRSSVRGFRNVAQGDFGYQVPSSGSNELASLTASFNQLSSRLHAIFELIDRIQQGSDLGQTLCFVAEQFPALLPLDWVGALFIAGDEKRITLEKSYRDGKTEANRHNTFELRKTLLAKALETDKPLHIPDMKRTAQDNPNYQFLNHLVANGLRDAIFLPITEQSPIPGVLVFATEKPDSYTPEHLELLANIAKLITHSFGRTVKLTEHARLAAIGGFASGIVHEIRSPLSTINLALEYLRKAELPAAAEKRAALAHHETERLARLLDEILLFAKPLKIEMGELDMGGLISQFLDTHEAIAAQRGQFNRLRINAASTAILGDRDRLEQVLLNLYNNACEASPPGSEICWILAEDADKRHLCLDILNPGDPIPEAILGRLFDPFFTTKSEGTGLGLGIVKRIVDAHGGEITIQSDMSPGTRVTVSLPLLR
ncbi:MAG: GAF domain-containing protein [Gammaproteobacteria bacterium]|nr:GAF domain-containing protein [Gammaproteobacteria bacterium]